MNYDLSRRRGKSSLGPFVSFFVIIVFSSHVEFMMRTHPHPSQTHLVLLQVSPVSPECVFVCGSHLLIWFIDFVSRGYVILRYPSWSVQHPLCVHVYIYALWTVWNAYIYSLYDLIYSCSTWPLVFYDTSEGRVEERTDHYLPGRGVDTMLILVTPLLLNQIENQETILIAASWPLVPLLCLGSLSRGLPRPVYPLK